MKKINVIAIVAIVVSAIAIVVSGISLYRLSHVPSDSGEKLPMSTDARSVSAQRSAETGIKVNVIEVKKSTDVRTVPYVGKVKAAQSTNLSSMNGGRIQTLTVEKGDVVKKGQLLAVVSSELVQSAHDIAKVTLSQAQDGYDRMMKLYKKGGVTELKRMEVETQLAKAKAAYNSSADALSKCRITAPFTGVIEDIYIEEGVDAGPLVPVLKLSNVDKLEITFPVPENEIAEVSVGEDARIEFPSIGMEAEGQISVKGVTASVLAHTYECRLDLTSPVTGLLPGMVCKVFLKKEKDGVMAIPLNSVMIDSKGSYVWSVNDGTVEKKRVTVSEFASDGVIVSDGLSEGEQVIVDGKRKVSTGMKVNAVVIK